MGTHFPPSEFTYSFHKRHVNSHNQNMTKECNVYTFKSHVWEYNIPMSQKKEWQFMDVLIFLIISSFFQDTWSNNPH